MEGIHLSVLGIDENIFAFFWLPLFLVTAVILLRRLGREAPTR